VIAIGNKDIGAINKNSEEILFKRYLTPLKLLQNPFIPQLGWAYMQFNPAPFSLLENPIAQK
jgi:hypothetical protein